MINKSFDESKSEPFCHIMLSFLYHLLKNIICFTDEKVNLNYNTRGRQIVKYKSDHIENFKSQKSYTNFFPILLVFFYYRLDLLTNQQSITRENSNPKNLINMLRTENLELH